MPIDNENGIIVARKRRKNVYLTELKLESRTLTIFYGRIHRTFAYTVVDLNNARHSPMEIFAIFVLLLYVLSGDYMPLAIRAIQIHGKIRR